MFGQQAVRATCQSFITKKEDTLEHLTDGHTNDKVIEEHLTHQLKATENVKKTSWLTRSTRRIDRKHHNSEIFKVGPLVLKKDMK